MPEGDSIHAAAGRLHVLEGEVVAVEARNPRAAALGIAPRLDGRQLERVEAVGKNLLFSFKGGVVLRSHLRMRGRWEVRDAGSRVVGQPWLILRGARHQAVLWHGPVLKLGTQGVRGLGPDIMAPRPDIDAMVARLRTAGQELMVGEALLDQSLVAGIGNLWRSEALFLSGISPWRRLGDLSDQALEGALQTAATAMKAGRRERFVYRRAGRPCLRCGAAIVYRRQGEHARATYWCPACQAGTEPVKA